MKKHVFQCLPALALILLALAVQTVVASAHASLNGSTPADGSMVESAPARFILVFSEPVSPLALDLVRPNGTPTALTNFELRDATLDIAAPETLDLGTHVLTWRVVSSDGHPVGGSVIFSIGEVSAQAPAVEEQIDWTVRSGLWMSKVALYIGLFIGVGGVLARTMLMPGVTSGSAVLGTALVIGLAGAVLSLGFQGLDALGAPAGSLAETVVWRTGYSTTFGLTVAVSFFAFLAAGASLSLQGTGALAAACLALLLGAGSLALSGHASAASPQWVMRPAVFLHAIAIAVWAGALTPLGLALRRKEAGAAKALARFSRIIPAFIGMLLATGAVLAVVQVGHPAALLDTAYGQVFVVKLVLLAGLFLLAAANRWKLTAPTKNGDEQSAGKLVRSIALETVLVLLIFGVAATWRFTPPPRVLAAAAAVPATLHVHGAKAMADLTIAPGRTGPVSVSAIIMTGDFGPLDAKEVTFVFSNPAAGIEPFRREAEKPGDGTWRADGVVLPLAGTWTVRVDVLITDFDIARLEGSVAIRP